MRRTVGGKTSKIFLSSITGGGSGVGLWTKMCLLCVCDGVPKRSCQVALIVGTLLNLINQGDALFGPDEINFIKLALTFAVPYGVATYSAVSYRLSVEKASGAADAGAASG